MEWRVWSDSGRGQVIILWETPRVGSKVVQVGGGNKWRYWSEALEPFLEIWGLADTGGVL